MTRKCWFLLFGLFAQAVAFSQSISYPPVPHPEWFKTVPHIDANTPDWAVMMYGQDPNFYEVVAAYEAYYRTNKYKKTEHGQNFKYWIKQVQRFVNDEGFIRLPSPAEEEQKLADLRKLQAKKAEKMGGTWTNIGPWETFISGTTTPYSNQVNVYSLDQSNSNSDILYCGSESGAMYKSINHGATWTQLTFDEVFSGGYGALEIHPTNPNIVMIGVNNRIYRTTDGGTIWTEVKNLGGTGYEIKYRPSNPDSVFCAASNGLYLSTNGGATWGSAIYTQECHDIDWHPTNPNVVYLLKSNTTLKRSELFRSDNGGGTWTLKDVGYYSPAVPANASIGGGKIAVSAAAPDRVYVCLIGDSKVGDNGWIGVLRSNDKGDNWTLPAGQYGSPYQPANTMPWNVAAYSDGYHQGFYNFDFEVSQLNADLMWIGTIRLSESSNGGTSFTAIGGSDSQRLSNVHADIQDIEVNGTEVWVANDGGIEYSTDNLQTFTSRKYGISGSNYWGFGAGWNEDILVGGRYHVGNSGYYQTYGVGNSVKLGGVEESTGYVHPTDRKAYFNQYWSGGTASRSIPTNMTIGYTDYGILPKIPNEAYTESNSSGIYFDPRYSDWMYMGEDSKIWRSKDKGTTFQMLRDFGASGRTLEIEIARTNPNYIYVVFKPNGTNARQIWRTTDGGTNWAQLPNVPASNRNKLEITLNPSDENDLWVCANDAANGQKVYRLISSGTAWQDMDQTTTLNGQHPYDIFFQGGTNNVVYLATGTTVMQYNNATSDWVDYGDGLPTIPSPLQMKPFYRDNKLRLATSGHGIWETPLAATSTPIAQPITTTDSVFCARDTIQFDSYSIASGSATYSWSFSPAPQWVSSLTVRNPKVVFGSCTTDCSYDVTLTVAEGTNTSTKTITDMVKVNSMCEPDTLPGQVMRTAANGDYFISQEANLTNLTHFTVTGWWKPNGAQDAYAALFSSGDWCAHCNDTEGLVFDYYASKLWYKWPGNASVWGNNSGMTVPLNEWSYVALVITPTSATMYLNGNKYVDTRALSPGTIQSIHIGKGPSDHFFKGDIDEVTMWRRALSDDEVRRLRHITREDVIPTDPDLIGYWQFNNFVNGTKIMDHAGKYHGGLVGGALLATSTAPIGGGKAQLLNLSAAQTAYDFSQVGTKVWMSDCEQPSGSIVATRLNIAPDAQPNTNDFPDNYWILNQYATSPGFPPLDSIELTSTDAGFMASLGTPSKGVVHLRSENGVGATWSTKSKGIRFNGTNAIRFNRKSNIQGSTQITLSNGPNYITEVDPGRICEADSIAGSSLVLPGGSGNYAVVPALNLNSNTVTISAWIKPNGLQSDNAGVIFCRGGNTVAGIHIKSNNELRYHWNDGQYNWGSGKIAPANEWSHVVLVVQPTKGMIYLNGDSAVNTTTHAIEEFNSTLRLGNDASSSARTFNGEIDEVCIWNRALSKSEIRELMHLTKEDVVNLAGQQMKVYLQFNETSGKAYDKTGNRNHATLNSASVTRTPSTAPVGGGVSNRTTVSSGGVYTFGTTGLKMGFPPSGTYPNGELLVSRLNVPPDQNPDNGSIVTDKTYWVVRNFGTNASFTALDSVVLENLAGISALDEASPSMFSLFKRRSNDFGNTWGTAQDVADLVKNTGTNKGKISFSTGNGINSFSQFVVADGRGVKVSPKVFLQGPFASGSMTDGLRSNSLLPTTEPYSSIAGFTHKNGGGLESCLASVLNTTGNDAIVDWMFIELRDATNPAVVQYTRSALLQRDGDIVDVDGTSPLSFRQAAPGNYYLAVKHRNHLGVRTPALLDLTRNSTAYDFTDAQAKAYQNPAIQSNSAQASLSGGVFGLWRANANGDGFINVVDVALTKSQSTPNQLRVYLGSDVNLDGNTNVVDPAITKSQATPNKSAHF
ncbi:MAG: hypothetical protein IT258_04225 [Saprospiraceae bacterium]|nr:hypothetical protein [Saprospiraceae bacterium]